MTTTKIPGICEVPKTEATTSKLLKPASYSNQQVTQTSKLLRRVNFISKEQLKTHILEFSDYFNRIMANPFKWTYQGKALTQG